MSTVSKETADDIVAGKFKADGATRIVKYDNAFGGVGYGVTFGNQDKDTYTIPTRYIRNPVIYWDADA